MDSELLHHEKILALLCAVAAVWQVTLKAIIAKNGDISSRESDARKAAFLLISRHTCLTRQETATLFNRDRSFLSYTTSKARRRFMVSRRFRLLVEATEHYWLTGADPQPHPAAMLTDDAWAAMHEEAGELAKGAK